MTNANPESISNLDKKSDRSVCKFQFRRSDIVLNLLSVIWNVKIENGFYSSDLFHPSSNSS